MSTQLFKVMKSGISKLARMGDLTPPDRPLTSANTAVTAGKMRLETISYLPLENTRACQAIAKVSTDPSDNHRSASPGRSAFITPAEQEEEIAMHRQIQTDCNQLLENSKATTAISSPTLKDGRFYRQYTVLELHHAPEGKTEWETGRNSDLFSRNMPVAYQRNACTRFLVTICIEAASELEKDIEDLILRALRKGILTKITIGDIETLPRDLEKYLIKKIGPRHGPALRDLTIRLKSEKRAGQWSRIQ